uniref:Uncharacterized protein n=1 Tax=Anguilla anguilla TaxID=7936 RepID=A0A0E9U061_ANGAN
MNLSCFSEKGIHKAIKYLADFLWCSEYERSEVYRFSIPLSV